MKVLSVILALFVFAAGCGQAGHPAPETKARGPGETSSDAAASAGSAPEHAGWWCDEHGVPEEICGRCSAQAAADFQKRGDWCQEHDRPDSQCFLCHPELEDRFAAKYEAKLGKKPPKPEG